MLTTTMFLQSEILYFSKFALFANLCSCISACLVWQRDYIFSPSKAARFKVHKGSACHMVDRKFRDTSVCRI